MSTDYVQKNKELVKRYQNGDKSALEEILALNRNYIFWFIRKQFNYIYPLEIDDLVQDCYIGIMKAASKYDERNDKASGFMNYANYYMLAEIMKDEEINQIIRYPRNVLTDIKRLIHLDQGSDYHSTRERVQDIVERTGWRENEVMWLFYIRHQTFDIYRDADMNPVDFEEAAKSKGYTYDYDKHYIDHIAGEDIVNRIFDQAKLTDKEKVVLMERYGLEGDEPKTYEEIGSIHGVSRSRIRMIEAKGMRKLRKPDITKKVKDIIFYS